MELLFSFPSSTKLEPGTLCSSQQTTSVHVPRRYITRKKSREKHITPHSFAVYKVLLLFHEQRGLFGKTHYL